MEVRFNKKKMKDYSGKMRSMDFHRGDNYEMNIILERPEFENKELVSILDSTGLKFEIKKNKIALITDNFRYGIEHSNSIERNYYQLSILQENIEAEIWKRENDLLTITYMIWSELAGKIPYDSGVGYSLDKWDKVYILNNIEIEDFENHYSYRLFSAKDLKNPPKSEVKKNIKLEIEIKGHAYVCQADKGEFNNPFEFWILGTSKLTGDSGNSDLWDGRFLPISKRNLEIELDVLCTSFDELLEGKSFRSAMKMRYDKCFLGWYFVESEKQYHIIDLARPN